jgi:hypothetical protein
MITITCLIGVVVLPSLLPFSPAAAAAAVIGAMALTVIAQNATPQKQSVDTHTLGSHYPFLSMKFRSLGGIPNNPS